MMWLWTPGLSDSKLTDETGIRIFGTGLKAFILQVHYDNPNDDTGKVDSSGFRIYYTSTLRANDVDVLERLTILKSQQVLILRTLLVQKYLLTSKKYKY
jgi:hypothetical protein